MACDLRVKYDEALKRRARSCSFKGRVQAEADSLVGAANKSQPTR